MPKSRRKPSGFHLQIVTDNAVFDGDQRVGCPAVVSLLRKVCVDLGAGHIEGSIRDVSGDTVGWWRYEKHS